MSTDQTDHQKRIKSIFYTRLSISIFGTVVFLASVLYAPIVNQFFHQPSVSQSDSASKSYPAFLVSAPSVTPQVSPPYTALTVFNAFRTRDKHVGGINYSYGWACCVTYQPEGKLIGWQESYGVELEIATFATPAEVKTDANDLLKHSVGYSVYTRNSCLFFYDQSISKTQLTDYSAVLSTACL